MQGLNVVLDSLDELGLVLPDGPSDVCTDEQGVVAGEDAKHLVGIPSRPELVPQTCCYASFHAIYALVIPEQQAQK